MCELLFRCTNDVTCTCRAIWARYKARTRTPQISWNQPLCDSSNFRRGWLGQRIAYVHRDRYPRPFSPCRCSSFPSLPRNVCQEAIDRLEGTFENRGTDWKRHRSRLWISISTTIVYFHDEKSRPRYNLWTNGWDWKGRCLPSRTKETTRRFGASSRMRSLE